jgi:hypothetical protein
VHPELGASVCQPSTRFARIPPAPLLQKGGIAATRYARIPPAPPSEELSVSHIFLLDTGGVLL